jgi:hypothetical protein
VTHELPREMADQVPREMLVLDGVGQCEAEAIYLDVPDLGARIGGRSRRSSRTQGYRHGHEALEPG